MIWVNNIWWSNNIALALQPDCDYKLDLISLEFNSKKFNKHLNHWTTWNTSDEFVREVLATVVIIAISWP